MIISSNDHETRVAILEDDLVAELFVERERSRGVVGNVYKGRVSKVLPGMQSSFVDIGLERDGVPVRHRRRAGARRLRRRRRGRGRRGRAGRCARRGRRAGASAPTAAGGGRRGGREPRSADEASKPQGRAEDRGPAQGRAGRDGPGGQGAAGHQGRAPDVARLAGRPLPGLHADGRSRRRLAQDRVARRAQPPARHRPRVPRAAGLHRRHHHPHGRLRPAEGRHPQRPGVLPQGVEGDPAEDGQPARAGGGLPRAEPGRQAAARPADRGLHRRSASTATRSTSACSSWSSG